MTGREEAGAEAGHGLEREPQVLGGLAFLDAQNAPRRLGDFLAALHVAGGAAAAADDVPAARVEAELGVERGHAENAARRQAGARARLPGSPRAADSRTASCRRCSSGMMSFSRTGDISARTFNAGAIGAAAVSATLMLSSAHSGKSQRIRHYHRIIARAECKVKSAKCKVENDRRSTRSAAFSAFHFCTFRSTGPTYFASGRISRLFAYCSRMCAVQPTVRDAAKTGVKRSVGIPSM